MARVLVVDDEPKLGKFVTQALELDGHEVLRAGGGREALQLLAERPFEIVVTDADQAAKLAHQHATVDATSQADSMHAAMANKAAMNAMSTSMMGGASGTCQTGSDCQNAAGMTRSMSPGAGMMGGSSGASNTGGATPGTPGSTTGGSSTPMGGKR